MGTVTNDSSTADRERRRWWTLAVFGFVALEGAAVQMRGAIVPVLERVFGVPPWQLGLVAPAGTVGFTVLVAVVGVLAGRYAIHRLLLVGVVGTGLGLAAMGLAPSFVLFLAALLGQGASSGVGRGSDRPLLSHLYPGSRGRLFGYYDTMWAAGATVGPLAVSAALWLGDWRLAFYALGVAFLPVALLVAALPVPGVEGREASLSLASALRLAREPRVAASTLGLVLVVGVEGGLFTWLTTFATGRVPDALAPVVLSVLLVAYVPGRFVAGRLSERVGYVPLALGQSATCLGALGFTFFVASGPWLVAGIFVVGLTLSGLYPTLLAYGTEAVPEHSAALNALALVAGAASIAGVPFLLGFVVGGAGVATAMRLLVVPLGLLVGLLGLLWSRRA